MNPGGPRGFNSLRKYLSLDSTVGENINPWIQQSYRILVFGFNSLKKTLMFRFNGLRKFLYGKDIQRISK